MTCNTVVHYISRKSLLLDIILRFVQPSFLRSSSRPSPLYFHFHRTPSYVVFLSSHHMPLSLQPPFLDGLCDFLHLRYPPYSFIYYHVQLRNCAYSYRSFLISASSNFFSCALFNAHIFIMSLPRTTFSIYHCVVRTPPLDLHTCIFLSFFQPLCTLWVTSASSSPSSANVDPMHMNVFTLFNKLITVSQSKWKYAC